MQEASDGHVKIKLATGGNYEYTERKKDAPKQNIHCG